jgi:hypothetical protein
MSGQGCSDLGAGLDCNGQTQSCTSMILVGPGSACGYLFNQQIVHCAGGAMCVGGTCVASAGLGQACDSVAGPFCITPSRCIPSSDGGTSGVCIIADATTCSN